MEYLVQPYEFDGGRLVAGEPMRAKDAVHARSLAKSLNCAGAVVSEGGKVVLEVGYVPDGSAPLGDPPGRVCHGFRYDLDGCVLKDSIDAWPAREAPELFGLKFRV